MTNGQSGTLVLKDQAGTYFLVALETLERGRVPAERTAEVERLIASTQDDADGADVQGHILPLVFAGFVAYSVGLVGGFAVTQAVIESDKK